MKLNFDAKVKSASIRLGPPRFTISPFFSKIKQPENLVPKTHTCVIEGKYWPCYQRDVCT
jgi:hypothetical protein